MKTRCLLLVSMLCTSAALAEPPSATAPNQTQSAAAELVEKQLLAPLKKAESRRKRFSRGAPPPVARRVRVLDSEAHSDARGKLFVRFAIDLRHAWDEEGKWQENNVTGCAYLGEREVFVLSEDSYRAARSLLGEATKARLDVCRTAQVQAAL